MSAPLPSTFTEAEQLSPFKLAEIWGNVFTWPTHDSRTTREFLQELAVMAALASWLHRWLPLQVHRAALAGASIDQITAAAGATPSALVAMWQDWADRQAKYGHLTSLDRARAASALGTRET